MGNANDTPLEQADALTDLANERAIRKLMLGVINGLDESWPHVRGTLECRYCHAVYPHPHVGECVAGKILFGV